jgi:hypothetical protein
MDLKRIGAAPDRARGNEAEADDRVSDTADGVGVRKVMAALAPPDVSMRPRLQTRRKGAYFPAVSPESRRISRCQQRFRRSGNNAA